MYESSYFALSDPFILTFAMPKFPFPVCKYDFLKRRVPTWYNILKNYNTGDMGCGYKSKTQRGILKLKIRVALLISLLKSVKWRKLFCCFFLIYVWKLLILIMCHLTVAFVDSITGWVGNVSRDSTGYLVFFSCMF